MKLFGLLLSLAACAFAQRLHVVQPAPSQILKGGEFFTMELQQDQSLDEIDQVSITVAAAQCFDACGKGPDQWAVSRVIYNGIYTPKTNSSDPSRGHFQDFRFQMPIFPAGEVVLSVAHLFKAGGPTLKDVFDYTTVHVNVQ